MNLACCGCELILFGSRFEFGVRPVRSYLAGSFILGKLVGKVKNAISGRLSIF